MLVGSSSGFAAIVLGWLPIAWGLGWWSAFSAIVVGAALGSAVLAPIALLGPKTHTNVAVSSGAYFGVVGRMAGSALGLLSGVGFTAISIWTGGQALVFGAHRLFGLSDGTFVTSMAYAAIGIGVVAIVVWGYALMLLVERVAMYGIAVVLILGIFAFAGKFNPHYHGGHYLIGGFWVTWALSVVTIASDPLSTVPFIGDWSRYIPDKKYSKTHLVSFAFIGSFVGYGVLPMFAAFVASEFKNVSIPLVQGMVGLAPMWYLVPLLVLGSLGGLANGATGLYGTGLDTSSLIPKLHRVQATVLISALTITFVFVGTLVWNALDSLDAFITLLIDFITPFAVIVLIGHWWRRAYYSPDDLQVFNRGQTGGIYWFTRGLNWRAMGALLPACLVACLFSNTTFWVGPFANLANGIELDFPMAALVGGVLYVVFLLAFPEPQTLYGPEGPRIAALSRPSASATEIRSASP
jgi:purine-cytosine permease-like protein